ncbi:hypothetical protein ACVIJ6_005620 [Bradyrhizobium sp. USDA 4369]
MRGPVPPARPKPLRRGEGPRIHAVRGKDVNGRDKPGQDVVRYDVVRDALVTPHVDTRRDP